jgi:hypothetical protein
MTALDSMQGLYECMVRIFILHDCEGKLEQFLWFPPQK